MSTQQKYALLEIPNANIHYMTLLVDSVANWQRQIYVHVCIYMWGTGAKSEKTHIKCEHRILLCMWIYYVEVLRKVIWKLSKHFVLFILMVMTDFDVHIPFSPFDFCNRNKTHILYVHIYLQYAENLCFHFVSNSFVLFVAEQRFYSILT